MSAGWDVVMSQLLAPAVVVAVSPFSIIVAVLLVLQTERARINGLAYLAGRLIALATVAAVCVQAPRLFAGLNRPISPWVLIVLGAVLFVFGLVLWAKRDRLSEEPKWLPISRIKPLGAAAIGAVLVLSNPKMLAATGAAGLLIGTARLGPAGIGGAIAYYSVVASAPVAVPVLAYIAVGVRAEDRLTRMRQWMQRHNGAISATILLAVGIALLSAGLRALMAT